MSVSEPTSQTIASSESSNDPSLAAFGPGKANVLGSGPGREQGKGKADEVVFLELKQLVRGVFS